jgi:hypothetical protein
MSATPFGAPQLPEAEKLNPIVAGPFAAHAPQPLCSRSGDVPGQTPLVAGSLAAAASLHPPCCPRTPRSPPGNRRAIGEHSVVDLPGNWACHHGCSRSSPTHSNGLRRSSSLSHTGPALLPWTDVGRRDFSGSPVRFCAACGRSPPPSTTSPTCSFSRARYRHAAGSRLRGPSGS